jgi:hypothetical protein
MLMNIYRPIKLILVKELSVYIYTDPKINGKYIKYKKRNFIPQRVKYKKI